MDCVRDPHAFPIRENVNFFENLGVEIQGGHRQLLVTFEAG